ncbi:hypothetical protein [Neisseria weixii]|nr:hypothetical protein [Neisseria weixii]
MKKIVFLLSVLPLMAAACSSAPKQPSGKPFPLNPHYQTGVK